MILYYYFFFPYTLGVFYIVGWSVMLKLVENKEKIKNLQDKLFWKWYYFKKWVWRKPPFSWLDEARLWVRYRTYDKYHVVNIPTLSKRYYDCDMRLLHASFALFSEFVEVELSHFTFACSYEKYKKEIPWWKSERTWIKENYLRLVEDHWRWAMKLRLNHDDNNEMGKGKLQITKKGTQGWCAKQQRELYYWWKKYLKEDNDILKTTPEKWYKKDQQNYQTEIKMLQKLASIKGSLWT
jgi:hypothetical protein